MKPLVIFPLPAQLQQRKMSEWFLLSAWCFIQCQTPTRTDTLLFFLLVLFCGVFLFGLVLLLGVFFFWRSFLFDFWLVFWLVGLVSFLLGFWFCFVFKVCLGFFLICFIFKDSKGPNMITGWDEQLNHSVELSLHLDLIQTQVPAGFLLTSPLEKEQWSIIL